MTIRRHGPGFRVIVADDHVLFSQCLRDALNRQADIEVIAEVADGAAAILAARRMTPDLVVMDVSMPGMNGIEATRQIRSRQPGVKVLCLSMHGDEAFISAVLQAGASGYALKDTPLDELIRAIRVVMSGETYLSTAVTTKVAAGFAAGQAVRRTSAFSTLTSREREILQLLAEGHTTKDIAARLYLSVKTVGTHREHLMEKLGIHDMAGLTKYAIREGLTTLDAQR